MAALDAGRAATAPVKKGKGGFTGPVAVGDALTGPFRVPLELQEPSEVQAPEEPEHEVRNV
jgi:hypothetical protein